MTPKLNVVHEFSRDQRNTSTQHTLTKAIAKYTEQLRSAHEQLRRAASLIHECANQTNNNYQRSRLEEALDLIDKALLEI